MNKMMQGYGADNKDVSADIFEGDVVTDIGNHDSEGIKVLSNGG